MPMAQRTLLLSTLLALAAGAIEEEDDVALINGKNIDAFVKSQPLVLIEFYAPWCGHCKALAPVWEEAADALEGVVNMAKIDCTVHSGACGKYGVRGYPTLKFFRDGEVRDYRGGRTLGARDFVPRLVALVGSS